MCYCFSLVHRRCLLDDGRPSVLLKLAPIIYEAFLVLDPAFTGVTVEKMPARFLF